jgi:hypothetical protein
LLAAPGTAWSADPQPGPPLTIHRAAGPIVLDGDLSDPGWKGIEPITTWFETNVGDNVEPQVKNAAYLTYDDKFLYAGFQFEDPAPATIRAPLGDHDAVPSSTDYAGVIVDSRNDGKTAQMFLANPRGVQYDAVTSDATGEDSSPDFYWDAVGKITPTGWTLEIRIPFSSLRYSNLTDPTWGILLYRNYPRDRRYQFFSARLPRDVNCFICNSSKLSGLSQLPHGSHLVVAPYATAQQSSAPRAVLGDPLVSGDVKTVAGLDLKWNPSSSAAIDATVKPDFSQIESDAAQIVANERFALFFPETRPFFLEGVDLLSTPLQAVYTRTVTAPLDGLRMTGKEGSTAYTALVSHDRGGGLVILPGPEDSGAALQDFGSDVGVVRVRHDLGHSFVSMLATGREIEGGGHNVVVGPDFQWRPRAVDSFTGQALFSESRTPNRPDLATEWDGRELSDHAALLSWSHNTPHHDWFLQGQDLGPNFRTDDGFIPQVGYREAYLDAGYTIRPEKTFLSRVRFFTTDYYDAEPGGTPINQRVSVGSGMDGRWNSFIRVELNHDNARVGSAWLERFRPRLYIQSSPGRVVNLFSIDAYVGQEIDFANAREGRGATLLGTLSLRPSGHLDLEGNSSLRWLDVNDASGTSRRLFTAQVERLKATWSFNARAFIRLIGQYVQTNSDSSLYSFTTPPQQADFSSSALFAYKLNWQTVVYAGYGDDRTFDDLTGRLEGSARQVFAKVSYAWQH